MIIEEARKTLENLRLPSGGALLTVSTGSGLYETDHALVMKAFDEIVRKLPFVLAGMDKFTAVETLLFQMLSVAAEVSHPLPQGYRKKGKKK